MSITISVVPFLPTEPLAFLNPAPTILHGDLGLNLLINCSTNDEYAAVSLLYSSPPSYSPLTERRPMTNKVLKRRQVFEILNLKISDAGTYACVATNTANQTIQWPRGTGFCNLGRGRIEIN